MTDGRKLALFALAMVAVFAAAVGIGALVSTDRGAADETHDDHPAAVGTQLGGLAARRR